MQMTVFTLMLSARLSLCHNNLVHRHVTGLIQLQILIKNIWSWGRPGNELDMLRSGPGIHCISVLTVSCKQVGQFGHSSLAGPIRTGIYQNKFW